MMNVLTHTQLQYDGTYEGLLTVVFECYQRKLEPSGIIVEGRGVADLFATEAPLMIVTSAECAARVLDGVRRFGGREAVMDIYKTFLSGSADREMVVWGYLKLLFEAKKPISGHYHEDAVMRVSQLVRQMGREIHRMHAFVRFQELADGLFFAPIEPDFDVLMLAYQHFEERYSAMEWCIYDIKRHYGIHYNGQHCERVVLDDEALLGSIQLPKDILSAKEAMFQDLWKGYFKSTNIEARRNMKLHLRHVPLRYWKYLTEKQ